MAGFNLRGLSAVTAQLKNIAEETRAKVMRSAMRDSFKPVQEAAKALVPRDSGELAEAITIGSAKLKSDGGLAVGLMIVTTSNRAKQAIVAAAAFGESQGTGVPPSRRWHFIEFGTARQPPQPFLRPALIEGAAQVLDDLARAVDKRIARALKKGKGK